MMRSQMKIVITAFSARHSEGHTGSMIQVRFANSETERKAIGFLAGRFSFRTDASGYTLVPEFALAALAVEGIPFMVDGVRRFLLFRKPEEIRATWEELIEEEAEPKKGADPFKKLKVTRGFQF